MLWKLLLSILALITPPTERGSEIVETEFTPTPYGPQTPEEEAEARQALSGPYVGGDMIFPENFTESGDGVRNERFRWPGYPGGAVIPFVIDQSLWPIRGMISQAMEQYHRLTCIRFVERTNQRDFVRLYFGNGCWSIIGRNGGMQNLSLGSGCNYVGLIVHELGHAIGLIHEHQRSDRNKYIVVYEQNVEQGKEDNFNTVDPNNELIFTQYDYNSIMHYGNYAFSRVPNRLPTMVARNGQQLIEPYNKPGLNQNDIYQIKQLYKC